MAYHMFACFLAIFGAANALAPQPENRIPIRNEWSDCQMMGDLSWLVMIEQKSDNGTGRRPTSLLYRFDVRHGTTHLLAGATKTVNRIDPGMYNLGHYVSPGSRWLLCKKANRCFIIELKSGKIIRRYATGPTSRIRWVDSERWAEFRLSGSEGLVEEVITYVVRSSQPEKRILMNHRTPALTEMAINRGVVSHDGRLIWCDTQNAGSMLGRVPTVPLVTLSLSSKAGRLIAFQVKCPFPNDYLTDVIISPSGSRIAWVHTKKARTRRQKANPNEPAHPLHLLRKHP